jgi:oligopeptide/dipeptide ABC transporter ATP-binding protein
MEAFFSIRDLQIDFKTFQGIRNLIDIEKLDLFEGEVYGLIGESGAGKSVLAYSILKLLDSPPAIIGCNMMDLCGESLLDKTKREMMSIRGSKISMIFQDSMSSLNPVFRIGDQLGNVLRKNRGLSGSELRKEIIEMLRLVQLPDQKQIAKKYPHELSGGQRQRVIIALALSCNPKFLIADEPTRNLDVTIQAQILKLILNIKQEFNITILYITSNPVLAYCLCDKIGIIHRGRIVETGNATEVLEDPLHPYSALLLQSKSRVDDALSTISPAYITENWKDLSGCRFVNKCPWVMDQCRRSNPELEELKENHCVACYYAQSRRVE